MAKTSQPRPVTPIEACTNPEGHEAHMALNGECPWCGHYDPAELDPHADVEDFG